MNIPSTNEIKAEKCRRSFYYFVQYFWDTIINEEPVWNWHIKYLCDELQEIGERVANREKKLYDLIINIPPGSSKSTIASEMYPAWCWAIDQTQRFLCGSYTDSISNDLAEKCRCILLSQKYKDLFPELTLTGTNVTKITNSRRGERYTTSTGGSATGLHAHQIIIDDPLNPKKAASDTERENANTWLSSTLSTRKVNKEVTVTIVIMQRLHENDCTGYLLQRWPKVKHICLPAEESERIVPKELRNYYVNNLLDPVRMNKEILADQKVELGSYGYAGQMQQNPAPEDGGILKKEWFDKRISRDDYNKIKHNIKKHIYIDGAYTADTENDPCGFMLWGYYNGRIYIDKAYCKHLEFPDFTKETVTFANTSNYNPLNGVIKIEPKASGLSAIQSLTRNTKLPVRQFKFPKNGRVTLKDSKITRAHAASPFVESGRVVLVEDTWNSEFIEQCGAFPNAAHDEYIDLLVMAVGEVFFQKQTKRITVLGTKG